MAHLLNLVDKLIGDALRGNLYTDLSPYIARDLSVPNPQLVPPTVGPAHVSSFQQTPFTTPGPQSPDPVNLPKNPGAPLSSDFQRTNLGGPPLETNFERTNLPQDPLRSPDPVFTPSQIAEALRRPDNADSGIPDSSQRPLNVNQGTQHPHENSAIIPPPQHGPPIQPQTPQTTPISDQVTTSAQFDGPAQKQSRILELAEFHNQVTNQVDSMRNQTDPPSQPLLERSQNVLVADSRDEIANNFHPQRQGPNIGPNGPEQMPAGQGEIKALSSDIAEEHGRISRNVYSNQGFLGNPTMIQGPGSTVLKHVDIVAGVRWLQNLTDEGIPIPLSGDAEPLFKGLFWNLSQFLLTSFNPTDPAGYGPLNALWNPLSLTLSTLPLLRLTSVTNVTAGAALDDVGGPVGGAYIKRVQDSVSASPGGEATREVGERLLQMRQGVYKKSIDGNQVSQVRGADAGFKGDIAASSYGGHPSIQAERSNSLLGAAVSALGDALGANLAFTIEEQVDTDAPLGSSIHGNLYNSERPYSTENAIMPLEALENTLADKGIEGTLREVAEAVKLNALFSPQSFPGGDTSQIRTDFAGAQAMNALGARSWVAAARGADIGMENVTDAPGLNAAMVDAEFLGETVDQDTAVSTGIVDGDPLDDENLYMPFMFQDLRDETNQFLYFRAFLKPGSVSETFAPEWRQERYYGRVDKIPTYVGTDRTINLAFDVVAFKPADLSIIYRKLEKLQSMVYPTYDTRGFMNAGPIVRMRVGDLFAADIEGGSGRGLPGYINSLDFTFEDGVWNITTNFKVPRVITVSLGFTVVHNGNPGIYPYEEAVLEPDGTPNTVGETTFGVAKYTPDAENNVNVKVSRSEMRRIFKTIRS